MSEPKMTLEVAMQVIKIEVSKAKRQHPNWPEDNKLLGVAIICEESGEAMRAAVQELQGEGEEDAIFREVVQTAAVCIRFLMGE